MGKASLAEQASAAAALTQAAFAGRVPAARDGADAAATQGGGEGEAPNTSADADLALALQMQEVGFAENSKRSSERSLSG